MIVTTGRSGSPPCGDTLSAMIASLDIREDDLSSAVVRELVRTHLEAASAESPPCSTHALDVDGLLTPEVTFWTAWEGDDLLGCGALKELDPAHGEIKSMHTAEAHRRRGVGATILTHLLHEADRRGYRHVSLETGSRLTRTDMFAPARALYRRFGFRECPPFGDYRPDPNSTFMTLTLGTEPG